MPQIEGVHIIRRQTGRGSTVNLIRFCDAGLKDLDLRNFIEWTLEKKKKKAITEQNVTNQSKDKNSKLENVSVLCM